GISIIHFVTEDVRKFVEREIKRGHTYDVVLLDPPVYGKGERKQVWSLETDLPLLLTRIQKLLSKEPFAIILNGYASGYSHIAYRQLLEQVVKNFGGNLSSGELAITDSSGHFLPSGIFARWER